MCHAESSGRRPWGKHLFLRSKSWRRPKPIDDFSSFWRLWRARRGSECSRRRSGVCESSHPLTCRIAPRAQYSELDEQVHCRPKSSRRRHLPARVEERTGSLARGPAHRHRCLGDPGVPSRDTGTRRRMTRLGPLVPPHERALAGIRSLVGRIHGREQVKQEGGSTCI